ncbi:helix-turn-helix domain-containing protein [Sphingobacterium sp. LRF_L2]|uniref:helix-turn-helix domain-containing protein n=1 Tax=Sphingobacterium sp. LRF_L2 TaxID=3369421 RepID=UPI003F61D9B4
MLEIKRENVFNTKVDAGHTYHMDSYELTLLETTIDTTVQHSFKEPILYNLLRGKKTLRLQNDYLYDYLPGTTMIVPPNLEMEVSFPGSSAEQPTQCLSLTIDRVKVIDSLNLLNERYPRKDGLLWQLNLNDCSFIENLEISQIIEKLFRLSVQSSHETQIIAELTLTELIILLSQKQLLLGMEQPQERNSVLFDIIHYIKQHITENISVDHLAEQAAMSSASLFRSFKKEFNISPVEYITKERIRAAKQILLTQPTATIAEIGYQLGFSTPNYFARVFKQHERITPSTFREQNLIYK